MSKDLRRKRAQIEDINDPDFFVYSSKMKETDIPAETLTHLRVDSSVTEIPARTFEYCKALVHVQLPATLTRIHSHAFYECTNLKWIQFLSNTTLENSSSDRGFKAGLIVIPETAVLQIDDCAFCLCKSLRNIIVSSVSTILGKSAFQQCKGLFHVELPEGLQVIEEKLFSGCESLTTVKVPSSVIRICNFAFSGCSRLASFNFPDGLLEIGKWAFCNCHSFETLHLPSTVHKIGRAAFQSCWRLKCIKLPPTLEIVDDCLFRACQRLEYIEIPAMTKKIGCEAFYQCSSLSHLRIPPSVDHIALTAFVSCKDLISIELPDQRFLTDDEARISVLSAGIRGCKQLVNLVANLISIELPDQRFLTDEDSVSRFKTIHGCRQLVNLVANPVLIGNPYKMQGFLQNSKIGSIVGGLDDFLHKTTHRFDKCPLNKLCYYQSYYSLDEAMMKLGSLMEDDPLAATTQVDEFGMTPLHILSLSQTPNLSMLLAVMNGGHPDHIILGKDSFGSTPMDYLCLNKMPNSAKVIRSLLPKRVDWLGLDPWKSDVMQVVDNALAVDRASRRREIGVAYFHLANYERKEVLSLVEIYLWSVKINEVDSQDHGVDRQSCRINSGATVVIPHVLAFLGKLELEDYAPLWSFDLVTDFG
eukprot:scaffold14678_cov97-Cylindrotheca_fusiformis.AAC.1